MAHMMFSPKNGLFGGFNNIGIHLGVISPKTPVAYFLYGALVVTLRTCYGALQIVVLLLLLMGREQQREQHAISSQTGRI